jgi:hypothetical protein
MAREQFIDWRPRDVTLGLVTTAGEICEEYSRQGLGLTLRQLYYQFVARGLLANSDKSYTVLGAAVVKGRMAGLLDWDHLEDRTRNLYGSHHESTPDDAVWSASYMYRLDKWVGQPRRVEVWVEKEALAGVVARAAGQGDVNYLACRGYMSVSEMYATAQRYRRYFTTGQDVLLLHLGDHDPSGVDMSRDIEDRLGEFLAYDTRLEVRRIALTMDQVREYDPPPNPAKMSDSRGTGYVERYGTQSWELDALDPTTLVALINEHVDAERDQDLWDTRVAQEGLDRAQMQTLSRRWSEVSEWLHENPDD